MQNCSTGLKTGEIECPPDIENCIICKVRHLHICTSSCSAVFLVPCCSLAGLTLLCGVSTSACGSSTLIRTLIVSAGKGILHGAFAVERCIFGDRCGLPTCGTSCVHFGNGGRTLDLMPCGPGWVSQSEHHDLRMDVCIASSRGIEASNGRIAVLRNNSSLFAGAKIGLSICSADASIVLAAEAETAAKAVAEAIAITAVQCEGQGDVEGKGAAVARARASPSLAALIPQLHA